ncbi:unnamed protein product, partial [Brenthis ino]
MEVILKIKLNKQKECHTPTIKWYMLEKNECAEKIRERVVEKMIEMGDMKGREVNECWNEMAGCIRHAAKGILGKSKGKRDR